jgi:ABC-2 type transport system ATP-binding protein
MLIDSSDVKELIMTIDDAAAPTPADSLITGATTTTSAGAASVASVPDSSALAIEATAVVKTFGSTLALDGLNLSVRTGEVHGFLGPNGSGKSTTIRILLGLMRADSGRARVLGGDPWRDAVMLHRKIAYVPGDVSLWPNLSGGEVIDLLGRLRGGLDTRRRDELLERFELDPRKKGRTYSKGNRQKVAIVAALSSDVELLIMDEPTTGLDPLMEAVFQDCIHAERDRGRTVLLSSHILSEVEALCDRVSIIRAGAVVETGSLTQLRHLTRTAITAETRQIPSALATAAGVHDLVLDGTRVRCDVDTAELDTVMAILTASGLLSLTASPPTLEELFLRHYGDQLADSDEKDGPTAGRHFVTGASRGAI